MAAGAASLTFFFYKLIDLQPDFIVLGFVFLATVFIYNFQRFVKLKAGIPFSGERLKWMKENRRLGQLIMITALIAMLPFLFLLDLKTLYVLLPAGFIALFYAGNFIHKKKPGLRDIPFLKAWLVALSWVAVTVVLPLLQAHLQYSDALLISAISIFLFIFSIAIIFDLRDVNLDEKSKRTIPQLFGQRMTRWLAFVCLLFPLIFLNLVNIGMWPCLLILLISGTLIIFKEKDAKGDFFYSFWLDGLLILPGVISLFF